MGLVDAEFMIVLNFWGCPTSTVQNPFQNSTTNSTPARSPSPETPAGTFAQPPLAAPVRIRDRRYIPAPRFLKRQNRFLEKGALPIGFASRPHPNGPLLA